MIEEDHGDGFTACAVFQRLEYMAVEHHQVGNFVIKLQGDKADVQCHGIALHHDPNKEQTTTTFVGTYDLHLTKVGGTWRIDAFKFNKKWVG